MMEIVSKPHVTKLEMCMEFLKMLSNPLFPREVEVHKIQETVPCSRMTVYRARDELKLRHMLLLGETDVTKIDLKKVKNMTLRSVNTELKSQLRYIYTILEKVESTGELPSFDDYDRGRFKAIELILGRVKKGDAEE